MQRTVAHALTQPIVVAAAHALLTDEGYCIDYFTGGAAYYDRLDGILPMVDAVSDDVYNGLHADLRTLMQAITGLQQDNELSEDEVKAKLLPIIAE